MAAAFRRAAVSKALNKGPWIIVNLPKDRGQIKI